MTKTIVGLLAGAILLGACGGAGSGGTAPTSAAPSASPDYYGY